MVNLVDDPECPRARRHRELETAEVKKYEDAVQRVMSAVKNFTNPFAIADKERLYSLASGAPVPLEVEVDVLRAEAVGRAAKADFVRRLESSDSGCFFDPIKRKKLNTMEACKQEDHAHILTGKGNYYVALSDGSVTCKVQIKLF